MKKVSIVAHVNKNQDHCKYGVDLERFIDNLIDLNKADKDNPDDFIPLAIKLKINPDLRFVEAEKFKTKGKSYYVITVDGVDAIPVVDNQIWMHELPQELFDLLETKRTIL